MNLQEQEHYYLSKEADDYFQRNLTTETDPPEYITARIEQCISMLEDNDITPSRVLEIGAAGGLLLSEIHQRFGSECLGIEPSAEAVKYAKSARQGIEMRQGVASDLPDDQTGYYDLVVLKGVFCWIGREELLRSIAEIDRVLVEGGYMLISDYLPEFATRNRNMHVKEKDIYCYKIDHSKIFLDTHVYTLISAETYFDRGETFQGRFDDTRNKTSLLRKSYSKYYLAGNQ